MKNNNKLDKDIFSKIYIKKLEHIEKLTNKEYKFQKGILASTCLQVPDNHAHAYQHCLAKHHQVGLAHILV